MENKVSELDQFKTNKEKRDFIKSQIDKLNSLVREYDGVDLTGDDKLDFLMVCVMNQTEMIMAAQLDSDVLFHVLHVMNKELDCNNMMALIASKEILSELNFVNKTPKTPHDIN
jgi:hypothetical protein